MITFLSCLRPDQEVSVSPREEGDIEVVRTLVHAFLCSEAKPDRGFMAACAAERNARGTCDNRRSCFEEGVEQSVPPRFRAKWLDIGHGILPSVRASTGRQPFVGSSRGPAGTSSTVVPGTNSLGVRARWRRRTLREDCPANGWARAGYGRPSRSARSANSSSNGWVWRTISATSRRPSGLKAIVSAEALADSRRAPRAEARSPSWW